VVDSMAACRIKAFGSHAQVFRSARITRFPRLQRG
jgi:hypothetical protein